MKWNITADRPVYLQLIEQLELAIVAGEYRAGARLPGVREMAAGSGGKPKHHAACAAGTGSTRPFEYTAHGRPHRNGG